VTPAPPVPPEPPESRRARPAVLATAVALPVTVVLVLLFARLGSGDDPASAPAPSATTAAALPAIPVAPPPALDEAAQKACQELVSALPTTLGDRPARPARSSSPYVAAWGEPPVVLRCGVERPAAYRSDSEVFDIGGVRWFPVTRGTSTVWTVVDRSVFVEVTAPTADASDPVARLSTSVSRALR
jgi:hypothetical protein